MQEDTIRQGTSDKHRIMVFHDKNDVSPVVHGLDNEEYDTLMVHDRQTGLLLLEGFSPSIIIIDCNETPSSAFEIIQGIRDYSAVPVIVLSSQSNRDNYGTTLGLGADDLIQKPFDGRVLLARIRALLRRSTMSKGRCC